MVAGDLPTDRPNRPFRILTLSAAVAHYIARSSAKQLCLRTRHYELHGTIGYNDRACRLASRKRERFAGPKRDSVFACQHFAVGHGNGHWPAPNTCADE